MKPIKESGVEPGTDVNSAENAEIDKIFSAGLGDFAPKETPETVTKEAATDTTDEAKKEEPTEEVPIVKPAEPIKVAEEETGDSLKGFLEEEESVKIPTRKAFPKLTEKDYRVNSDGTVEVFAEHLHDDIVAIRDTDARIFLKIFKSKDGKAKTDVISKALGFKGDATRSSSQMARDVITAYVDANRNGDTAKADEIYKNHLPDGIKNMDDQNFSFAGQKAEKSEEKSDEPISKLPYKKQELKSSVSSFVDRNLYKHLDKNSTSEDVERARADLNKSILENGKIYLALKKDRYDPSTGQRLTSDQAVEAAFNEVMGDKPTTAKDNSFAGGGSRDIPVAKVSKEEDEMSQMMKIFGANLKGYENK